MMFYMDGLSFTHNGTPLSHLTNKEAFTLWDQIKNLRLVIGDGKPFVFLPGTIFKDSEIM